MVRSGEVIGVAGDQADMRDGLHFEVRNGSEPQDPLTWLDPAQMLEGEDNGPR